jgi:hypothetical protein
MVITMPPVVGTDELHDPNLSPVGLSAEAAPRVALSDCRHGLFLAAPFDDRGQQPESYQDSPDNLTRMAAVTSISSTDDDRGDRRLLWLTVELADHLGLDHRLRTRSNRRQSRVT